MNAPSHITAERPLEAHVLDFETVSLCHGCDAELGPDRFCASCEEVMPTYEWEVA